MKAYPEPSNIVVIKEFYANAMMIENEAIISYTSYVSEKIVSSDDVSINSFLGIKEGNNSCEYVDFINTYWTSFIDHPSTQTRWSGCD